MQAETYTHISGGGGVVIAREIEIETPELLERLELALERRVDQHAGRCAGEGAQRGAGLQKMERRTMQKQRKRGVWSAFAFHDPSVKFDIFRKRK